MANSSLLVCTKIASLLCGVNVTLNGLDPGDCAGFMEEGCGWSIQQDSGWSLPQQRCPGLWGWELADYWCKAAVSLYEGMCMCCLYLLCFHRAAESGWTWLTPSHRYRDSFLLSSPIDLSQNRRFHLTCSCERWKFCSFLSIRKYLKCILPLLLSIVIDRVREEAYWTRKKCVIWFYLLWKLVEKYEGLQQHAVEAEQVEDYEKK